MFIRLSELFRKYARGWLVLVFLALDVLFMAVVMPGMSSILGTSASNNLGPLDLKFFYTPEQAFTIIDSFGEAGRAAYRIVELTADIIYPIVYTIAFGLLLTWIFKQAFPAENKIQRLNILPIGAWFFDLLENIGIVIMLSLYPSIPDALAWITAIFTAVKWIFAFASMALIVISVVAWGIKATRK